MTSCEVPVKCNEIVSDGVGSKSKWDKSWMNIEHWQTFRVPLIAKMQSLAPLWSMEQKTFKKGMWWCTMDNFLYSP